MKIFSLFMTVMYLIMGNTADHIQKAEPIDEVISNASMSEIEVSDLFDSLIENQSSIVLDDYYSSVYFSNLKDNFSVNSNGKVRNTDYSNEVITDPETCDRQMNKDYNYTRFIGFFEVTPLNTKY